MWDEKVYVYYTLEYYNFLYGWVGKLLGISGVP